MGEIIKFPKKTSKENNSTTSSIDRVQTKNEQIAEKYFALHKPARQAADRLAREVGTNASLRKEAGEFLYALRVLEMLYEDFAHWAGLSAPLMEDEYTFYFVADRYTGRDVFVEKWIEEVERLLKTVDMEIK